MSTGLLTEFHDKLTCNSTAKQKNLKIIKGLKEKQGLVATSIERVTKKGMKQYLCKTINGCAYDISTTATLLHSHIFCLKHCQKIECVFRLAMCVAYL